jgi:hypothetical protein
VIGTGTPLLIVKEKQGSSREWEGELSRRQIQQQMRRPAF